MNDNTTMSTIAAPRDSSIASTRRTPFLETPTTSARPSIDSPRLNARSASVSPNRGPQPRRNRAALREYYNLKKEQEDRIEELANDNHSDVGESELDEEGFDGEVYVKRVLETQNLEELLRTYNGVLTDIRALDAEKKALVYDNYSKLIAATETIRKMRSNMDPLNPMASTLDPAIAQIYERAAAVKVELRETMSPSQKAKYDLSEEDRAKAEKKQKTKRIVTRVLETPARLRELIAQGKVEAAKEEWKEPLRLLQSWKEKGVGGADVQDCIDDGEAALQGEAPGPKSWGNVKGKK